MPFFLAIIVKKTNKEDLHITAHTNQQPPGVHYETSMVRILGPLTPCYFFSHMNSPEDAPEKSRKHGVSFMSLLGITPLIDDQSELFHTNQGPLK